MDAGDRSGAVSTGFDSSIIYVNMHIMHPLDGAYVRLDRAKEHLAELSVISAGLVDREMELRSKELRASLEAPGQLLDLNCEPSEPIPLKYSVLIGETIYNLRACLDYLVYELALLDSGAPHDRTQFPIYPTAKAFRERPKSCLDGINTFHVAAIEKLQPYNGVAWTEWLQAISNPDKHRHLMIAQQGGTVVTTTSPNPIYPTNPNDPRDFFVSRPQGSGGYVQLHITVFIAFADELPVINALEEIRAQVTHVLSDFKPEFEAR